MGDSGDTRRFTIQPHVNDFRTGITSDGRQVLMGVQRPNVAAVFFGRDGRLIECVNRPIPFHLPASPSETAVVRLEGFARQLEADWQAEIGFRPGTISVCRFRCQAGSIQDLPEYYEEFLQDPEEVEPIESIRQRMHEAVEDWQRMGRFVLYWCKDYWMNGDGTVYST